MTLLNEADKVYIGSSPADRVYAGANLVWEAGAAVAPTVRSTYGLAYAGGRTNTILDKPTGTLDGDRIFIAFFTGAVGAAVPTTPPAGFNHATGSPIDVSEAGYFGRFNIFHKMASGEGVGWTMTHATAATEGFVCSVKDVNTTTPIDAISNNSGQGISSTINGVTTTVANTMLLNMNFNWTASGATSPPTGFTELWDGIITAAWKPNPAIGATGNFTQNNVNVAGTDPWGALLAALRPA
jgi:hypothetical protein